MFRRKVGVSGGEAPSQIIGRMNGRGIFLLAFTRSGTTLLTQFLASHPEIRSLGEVLNEGHPGSFFRDYSRRALLRYSMSPSSMEHEFYGFLERTLDNAGGDHGIFDLKFQCLHMIDGNWRLPGKQHFKIFDILSDAGAPVILLERRKLVARHLSAQLARRCGRYHSFSKPANGKTIEPFTIDIDGLAEEIRIVREQYAAVRSAFSGSNRFLALDYEDIVVPAADAGKSCISPQIAERMADFLNVGNAFDLTPRTGRMAPPDYRAFIRNMDEVDALRATLEGGT